MKENEVKLYSETDLDLLEYEDIQNIEMNNCFAIEFLMPRKLFERAITNHWKNNGNNISCNSVAEEFGINYMHIIERGNELKIFTKK